MPLLQLHPGGLIWKKSGGSKLVDIKKDDVAAVWVAEVPRDSQLTVRQKSGKDIVFYGMSTQQETDAIRAHTMQYFGVEAATKKYAVAGHNWGEAELDGTTLRFVARGGEPAFELPLGDVAAAQVHGKNEMQIGFHTDDTDQQKDSLVELSFYVPPSSKAHVAGVEGTAANALHEKLLAKADIGTAVGEALAAMEGLYVVAPRGRFTAEFHPKFLRLQGTANDFKVQYDSMLRIFVLPRAPEMQGSVTWVNVALDPPIRKGQTYYPHLLLQFPSDAQTELEIDLDEDELKQKYGDKLEPTYAAATCEVFAKVLRGFSSTKITRPQEFHSAIEGTGSQAVRCSFKTDEGMLFPLAKQFFYAPKPPMIILYEDVGHVEFQRQQSGTSASSRTFDLVVRTKMDTEYQFRSIARAELQNLLSFFKAKSIRITNLRQTEEAAEGGGDGRKKSFADGDDGAEFDDESDEDEDEDEDFDGAGKEESSDEDVDYGASGSDEDEKALKAPPKKKAKKKESEE